MSPSRPPPVDPQRNNPQSDPTAAPVAYDASLVGRRVLATFTDEDAPQWYPATLVMYRPKATSYNFLMHFDDGWQSLVGLPDPSVRLLREKVQYCTCERCMLVSDMGELLGPGGRVLTCLRGGQ